MAQPVSPQIRESGQGFGVRELADPALLLALLVAFLILTRRGRRPAPDAKPDGRRRLSRVCPGTTSRPVRSGPTATGRHVRVIV